MNSNIVLPNEFVNLCQNLGEAIITSISRFRGNEKHIGERWLASEIAFILQKAGNSAAMEFVISSGTSLPNKKKSRGSLVDIVVLDMQHKQVLLGIEIKHGANISRNREEKDYKFAVICPAPMVWVTHTKVLWAPKLDWIPVLQMRSLSRWVLRFWIINDRFSKTDWILIRCPMKQSQPTFNSMKKSESINIVIQNFFIESRVKEAFYMSQMLSENKAKFGNGIHRGRQTKIEKWIQSELALYLSGYGYETIQEFSNYAPGLRPDIILKHEKSTEVIELKDYNTSSHLSDDIAEIIHILGTAEEGTILVLTFSEATKGGLFWKKSFGNNIYQLENGLFLAIGTVDELVLSFFRVLAEIRADRIAGYMFSRIKRDKTKKTSQDLFSLIERVQRSSYTLQDLIICRNLLKAWIKVVRTRADDLESSEGHKALKNAKDLLKSLMDEEKSGTKKEIKKEP